MTTEAERERAARVASQLLQETLVRHRSDTPVWPGTEHIAEKLVEFAEAERERAEDEKGLEWVMAFNVKNGRAPTRKEVWQAARREERKRCAEYVEAQKAKYPGDVFKHLDNFKAAGCLDCCSAAAILHTLDWLAKALSTGGETG